MKVIIAGPRTATIHDVYNAVKASGLKKSQITEVVCGEARGADKHGKIIAEKNGIPVKSFPVEKQDYDKNGKRAPLLRNEEMAKYGECLIAVWDGKSNGTRHMIKMAEKYDIPYFIYFTGGIHEIIMENKELIKKLLENI